MSMPHTKFWESEKLDLRQDRRGLRFSFRASAEVSLEGPAESLRACVTDFRQVLQKWILAALDRRS
jgi:hypothetical protein